MLIFGIEKHLESLKTSTFEAVYALKSKTVCKNLVIKPYGFEKTTTNFFSSFKQF